MRKKRFFRSIAALVSALLILTCVACKPEESPAKNQVLYGFAEPMVKSQVKEFNREKAAGLAKAMNAKSFRSFIEVDVLDGIRNADGSASDIKINERQKLVYDSVHQLLRDNGIEQIVGAVGFYPRVPSTRAGDLNTVPDPFKENPDTDYPLFLEKIEACWFEMAKAFPDIKYWEVGNEPNMNGFLHPVTYVANAGQDLAADMSSNPTCFDMKEKASVLTDIMFYANRGMKRGNPDSVLIVPGLAPVGFLDKGAMKIFLEQIYENIGSGTFPTTLTEKSSVSKAYFQGLAWHPYYHMDRAPTEEWTTLNNEIYDVAKKHGDDGIRVWFTEFGMSDTSPTTPNATDENQAEWYAEYFRQMDEMPYLEACHVFRFFECSVAAEWGGLVEWKYGIFREPDGTQGFTPKKKALALKTLMGGTGDLNMYA